MRTRGWTRAAVAALAALAAGLLAAVAPGTAAAAPWCGTVGTADRPAAVAGDQIRVVYALPSDGPDRSAERVPQISADVDAIGGWWQGQDSSRTPRFDLTPFPCGLQADVTFLRLPQSSAELLPIETRVDRILAALPSSAYLDYLVYYDGPVNEDVCGQGGGSLLSSGIAVVYLQACPDIVSVAVAAHELVHAFGALVGQGPPNACPDDRSHPCDSTGDILFPYAQPAALAAFALDVGHDDYYAHSGTWDDVQDSPWLVRLDRQVRLAVALAGTGRVHSSMPGLDCTASCGTSWNADTDVELTAEPGPGLRLVRWGVPGCSGTAPCTLHLSQATSLALRFAPTRFDLTVSVAGKGRIASRPVRLSCPTRCTGSFPSFAPVTLVAAPAKGWRLKAWSGGCRGAALRCTVQLDRASRARATFARVKKAA